MAALIATRSTGMLILALWLILSGIAGLVASMMNEGSSGVVNELLVLTQPGHLQRYAGSELTPSERNVIRAQLVRERLSAAEHEAGSNP